MEEVWIERPIFNRFEQIVARHGDKVAVDDDVTRLTYCELRRAVTHLAQHIIALVPMGHPVGILLPIGARFPIAALACLAVGRPYIPIDPSYPAERNEQLVREAGLSAVIGDGSKANNPCIPTSLPYLDIANSLEEVGDGKITIASADGPAVILYTSGSSGQPKGICYDQRAILERVAHATTAKRLCSDDRIFLLSSPGTIGGLRIPYMALLNGATLYWADPHQIGIDGALRFLQYARPTVGFAVPALLRTLLGLPEAKQAFSYARVIRTGGDVLLKSDLPLWQNVLPRSCRIFITLTSTEMPGIFEWFVPPEWKADSSHLPVGYPRPGISFTIVDDNGAPVPMGEVGELVVKSPYLALGHWQNGVLQPGPFRPDPDDAKVRIFNTGDLVRLRDDGLAEMIGRNDRRLKIRGFRIEPGDIENALRACASVADAALIAHRTGEEVTSLIAYVVPREPGNDSLAEELKKELAMRLPLHMRPSQIRFIDAIPQLPGYKIDIQALEKLEEKQCTTTDLTAGTDRANRAYEAPRNDLEISLATVWERVLGVPRVGINDNFFDLGGHSLSVIKLTLEMKKTTGVEIDLGEVFLSPTIAQLVMSLGPGVEKKASVVVPLQPDGDGIPIFCVCGINVYRKFAESLGTGQPVFGVYVAEEQALTKQVIQGEKQDVSIERLAEAYEKAILRFSPEGPYRLAGFSFGGIIAMEIASRMRRRGAEVNVVMLFDTLLPQGYHRNLGKWLVNKATTMMGGIARQSFRDLSTRFLKMAANSLSRNRNQHLPGMGGWRVLGVGVAFRHAARRWQARQSVTDVNVILFMATDHSTWGPHMEFDEDYGWRRILGDWLNVVKVPGAHRSMLEPPNVAELARKALLFLGASYSK